MPINMIEKDLNNRIQTCLAEYTHNFQGIGKLKNQCQASCQYRGQANSNNTKIHSLPSARKSIQSNRRYDLTRHHRGTPY